MVFVLASGVFAQNSQNFNKEIPISTWQPPAYLDLSANQSAHQKDTGKNEAATQTPFAPSGTVLTQTVAFVGIVPCRLVDTRGITGETGAFGPPIMTAGSTRTIPVLTNQRCNIPATAVAYSMNFTVVPNGSLGFLTAWPTGNPPSPTVSILNDLLGTVLANFAVVAAGTNGSFDMLVTDQTHVIVDINGYYAPLSSITVAGNLTVGGNILNNSGVVMTTTGTSNFGAGLGAQQNGTGANNTAVGAAALTNNAGGSFNTAVGNLALQNNGNGSANTAVGYNVLPNNSTGSGNSGLGGFALQSNTSGTNNMGVGNSALSNNTTGSNNTAVGALVLGGVTATDLNTGIGYRSLFGASGTNNTAIGSNAGFNLAGGSNNIDIGNTGATNDSGVIRIGTNGTHTTHFTAGISGVTTGLNNAVPVLIDTNGQLGTANSSARFKEDISDMDAASDGLLRLRPVTFRYITPYADGSKPVEYGLIAEEVAKVFPDLVVKGNDGQIQTVQYQKLTPMLLNEVQKQHRLIEEQQKQLQEALDEIRALQSRLAVAAERN